MNQEKIKELTESISKEIIDKDVLVVYDSWTKEVQAHVAATLQALDDRGLLNIIILNEEQAKKFAEALEAPAKPNAALTRLSRGIPSSFDEVFNGMLDKDGIELWRYGDVWGCTFRARNYRFASNTVHSATSPTAAIQDAIKGLNRFNNEFNTELKRKKFSIKEIYERFTERIKQL